MKERELFDKFVDDIMCQKLHVIYAQMWKNGEMIAEYQRIRTKTRLNMWSCAKGVVSCAVGIAEAEGLLGLDEKIADIFPEYVPENISENLKKVTIRHLLTMTSGLKNPLFFGDDKGKYQVKDWIRYFFQAEFANQPGTRWLYSNFNTYMLGCAIERRAGVNLLEYLRDRFFEPLDIGNPEWTLCPKGHVYAGNGLYLTIDEMSRFGEMLRNMGNYKGRQIVPETYMRTAVSKLVDNSGDKVNGHILSGCGYGYQFLMNPKKESFRLQGKYGQYCMVDPQQGIVFTVMSLDDRDNEIGDSLWKNVMGKLETL